MATLSPRPKMGHRSISEQAPLFDPSTSSLLGSRLRGSMASSGSMLRTGSQLPYSPLLPMPPPPSEAELGPAFDTVQTPKPACEPAPVRPGHSTNGAKGATGMIRSYSVPVATQAEHEEHQRLFARNGGSGAGFASLHKTQFDIPAWHQSLGMSVSASTNGHYAVGANVSTSPPLSRSARRYSPASSPTARNKHLAGSPPSRSHRSPLSPISANIPLTFQQDEEMLYNEPRWSTDALDAPNTSTNSLCSSADLSRASDMSDEARTPRPSSPDLHHLSHATTPLMDSATTITTQNKLEAWPHLLEFIHPDHLA